MAEHAGNPNNGQYEAVVGLGQPSVEIYTTGEVILTAPDKVSSFMLQMQIQEPHYAATACFNYYWNSTNLDSKSQMVFGYESLASEFCIDGFSNIYSATTANKTEWSINIASW